MKKLLLTTALIGFAAAAGAQTTTTPLGQGTTLERTPMQQGNAASAANDPSNFHASEVIGATLYHIDAENDASARSTATGAMGTTPSTPGAAGTAPAGVDAENFESIGEINDIVLGPDGEVKAVLVDVGGFLGMGERTVAAPMSSIKALKSAEDGAADEDRYFVWNASRTMIEQAPEYERPDN